MGVESDRDIPLSEAIERAHALAEETAALVDEFAARLTRLNYAQTTQKTYLLAVRQFFRAHPTIRLEQVSPEHIERHLGARRLTPRSFCSELANLGAFFGWVVRHKRLLRTNPCAGVERPRWKMRLRRAPTYDEFLAVRACCRTLEEAAVVELLYFAGLRASELLGLRSGDVDLERRRLRILGKGGYERVAVFPSRTQAVLRLYAWRHFAVHPAGLLFRNPRRPGSRGRNWLAGLMRRLGNEARLSFPLSSHVLRHGYFRLCKTRGVPLEVAAKLGGHKSIRMVAEVYGQLDIDDLQSAYDRHIAADSGGAPHQ